MKSKHQLIVAILILGFAVSAVILHRQRLAQLPSFVPQVLSLPMDWEGRQDPLSKLERLSKTVEYVDLTYVDPKRIDTKNMLKECLKALARSIPEVRVVFPNNHQAIMIIGPKRREFDLRVNQMPALRSSLSEVLKFVRSQHFSNYSNDELETLAINALLSTLDPHSVYLSQDQYKEMKASTHGHFGGLGIVIGFRDKKLTIISPIDGTPAAKAGLKAGDHITKIGNETTTNMLLNEAVQRMRGPKGTKVSITVMRDSWDATKSFSLVRDEIVIVSVESAFLPEQVGYVRIKSFQKDTGENLRQNLRSLHSQAGGELKGLILDMRSNPGGVLDQAVEVADIFVDDGVIVSTVGVQNRMNKRERASKNGTEPRYPMVILVDEGSASASEIVAGALKHSRAVIIGNQTFGKGTVQRLFELPLESALKLTIAQYLTPGNVSIQSIGITPDILTQSVVISPKGFNLFPSSYKHNESNLEGHFENPAQQESDIKSPPSENPKYTLSFLEDLDAEGFSSRHQTLGDSAEKRQEKILKDIEVVLARKILSKAKTWDRLALLALAKEPVAELQKQQEERLVKTLAERGIDWQKANGKANCSDNPKLEASIKPIFGRQVQSGDKTKLQVQLSNPTTCTFFQTWVETESKQYFFNGHELLFGKLAPGASLIREVEAEVPQGMPQALIEVTFHLKTGETQKLTETQTHTSIVAKARPQFSYDLTVSDSNNNGLIESGETIKLLLKLANTGEVESSSETSLALRNREGQAIEINNGHAPIGALGAGKKKQLELEFTVGATAKPGDTVTLDLSISDYGFRFSQRNPLEFKIGTTQAKTIGFAPPSIVLNKKEQIFTQVQAKFFTLAGKVKDDVAVKDLFIMVNDNKVHYELFEGLPSQASLGYDFSASIPLEPGENQILVMARDSQGIMVSEQIILQRVLDLVP